jgi:hypothetical protein
VLCYGLGRGFSPHRNSEKKRKKLQKTHPECMKIGEIDSEVRRWLMDDEQLGISWENGLKYQMEQCIYI